MANSVMSLSFPHLAQHFADPSSSAFFGTRGAHVGHELIPGGVVPFVAPGSAATWWVLAVNAVVLAIYPFVGVHRLGRLLAATRASRVLALIASPFRDIPAFVLQPIFDGQWGKVQY